MQANRRAVRDTSAACDQVEIQNIDASRNGWRFGSTFSYQA